jgi:flavin reductase (DIM6/NTAB) family NADH-FMN oxidoreductase RutF
MPADADRFRQAMRLTASGVAVISTDGPSGRTGITVSTFQSLSTEPPTVMACIRLESRHLAAIEGNACFVANILAADQQDQARIFAAGSPEERDSAFANGNWRTLVSGAPALGGAVCNFDCTVADIVTHASHRIIIGTVLAVSASDAEPLIYSGRSFRRLQKDIALDWSIKGEFDIPL